MSPIAKQYVCDVCAKKFINADVGLNVDGDIICPTCLSLFVTTETDTEDDEQ